MSVDKKEAEQQRPLNTSASQAERTSMFRQHLDRASSIVSTWPAWKQQILGGSASQPSAPAPKPST